MAADSKKSVDKKEKKFDKKHISHDRQAESARTKFGKETRKTDQHIGETHA